MYVMLGLFVRILATSALGVAGGAGHATSIRQPKLRISRPYGMVSGRFRLPPVWSAPLEWVKLVGAPPDERRGLTA